MGRFRAADDEDVDEFTRLVMERFRVIAPAPARASAPIESPAPVSLESSAAPEPAEPAELAEDPPAAATAGGGWISDVGSSTPAAESQRAHPLNRPHPEHRVGLRPQPAAGEPGLETEVSPDDEPSPERVEGTALEPIVPLGELLVGSGRVSDDALATALAVQPGSGKRIGELLVDAGALSERDLVTALAEQLSMQTVDLRRLTPDHAVVSLLAESAARDLLALPVRHDGDRIEVAVADPRRPGLAMALAEAIESPLHLVLASESDVLRTIDVSYRADSRVGDVVRVFEERARLRAEQDRERSDRPLATVDEKAPAVQVVNLILEQAVKDRASDVHIEPGIDCVRIRNRTDGALHDVFTLPASMSQSLVSRIKVMAELNIVERRRPQDGQIEVSIDGRELDVRVSTTCTIDGEKVVLRLLDKSRALHPLHELGMSEELFAGFYDLVRSPFGMVICAGPTGSGKTTTLYATLSEINRSEINVMTIEDPVEYVFASANQIQINEQAGITFATGLRSILRQDPDAILVGEIRDAETARVAVQAALTGHLVLSSLHATDATAAVHRFLDMGVESFLLSSALLGIVGQRLVRRVCPHCRGPHEATVDERAFWDRAGAAANAEFMSGAGCTFCAHTGYLERTGIYEVLRITPAMKHLIVDRAPHDVMKEVAVNEGMVPMREQALKLVAAGETTVAEVMRVVYML